MKRIIAILFLCLALLTGCSTQERTVYQDAYVTISRSAAQIRVINAADGTERSYTMHRIKRAKNAANTSRTVYSRDGITIEEIPGMWILQEPEKVVYIHW